MVDLVDRFRYTFLSRQERYRQKSARFTGGNNIMTFQEQLITLRKQQGLSQEQLGAKLGVTRQTVSKWELGITTPEMDKLMLLADLFHISIDELVGRKRKNGESETEHGHTARRFPR